MIGNPHWFARRKYTGWGFTPKTWQGWVYILVMILPIIAITSMRVIGAGALAFLFIWAVVFAADFIHIMVRLQKDERERAHEAIAERNALWAMLTILVIGVGYQAGVGIVAQRTPQVDPVILIALAGAVIVKMVSNLYLDRKD